MLELHLADGRCKGLIKARVSRFRVTRKHNSAVEPSQVWAPMRVHFGQFFGLISILQHPFEPPITAASSNLHDACWCASAGPKAAGAWAAASLVCGRQNSTLWHGRWTRHTTSNPEPMIDGTSATAAGSPLLVLHQFRSMAHAADRGSCHPQAQVQSWHRCLHSCKHSWTRSMSDCKPSE